MESKHCSKCGKDIYRSSTGCLCPPGVGDIVDGPGTYGMQKPLVSGDDGRDLTCPKCGAPRKRASKDQTQCMPCDKCDDDGAPALKILERLAGK